MISIRLGIRIKRKKALWLKKEELKKSKGLIKYLTKCLISIIQSNSLSKRSILSQSKDLKMLQCIFKNTLKRKKWLQRRMRTNK
jgi:hypothetical protein